MFSIEQRANVRDWVVGTARSDERIVGGATTGSLAAGKPDKWSDVDLAFAYRDGVDPAQLLTEFTRRIDERFGVLHHFDLQAGDTVYRVLLLDRCLEVDIGMVPAASFGARGPKFQLLFGTASENVATSNDDQLNQLVGLCWHHVLHARAAIERAQPWKAEYYISALRDHSLEIACVQRDLPSVYARGVDLLPEAVKACYSASLVRSLDRAELRRALEVGASAYFAQLEPLNPQLAHQLRIGLHSEV
jgi:hypothetical protein